MKWLAATFAWIFGMLGFFQSEPSYLMNNDTSDTAAEEDTAEDTEDTSAEDTSSDTADTAQEDTAATDTAIRSAMEMAGETGGFGCATVSSDAAISIWIGVIALGIRRREQ